MANEILPATAGDLEKFKYKVEIFKWIISSVVLVIITTIIDWGFKDRAAGLQEIQQYDKYATELIILNDNPRSKRMLAQYFSNVVPSEKLREGWKNYYKAVNDEYIKFLVQDSITKIELQRLKSDSARLSGDQKLKKVQLQQIVDNNQRLLNQSIVIPNNTITPTVFIQINREEQRAAAKQIQDKISTMGFSAPGVELVENVSLTNNELRYFRQNDLDAVKAVQGFLEEQGFMIVIKYLPVLSSKTKEGTIELWLK